MNLQKVVQAARYAVIDVCLVVLGAKSSSSGGNSVESELARLPRKPQCRKQLLIVVGVHCSRANYVMQSVKNRNCVCALTVFHMCETAMQN